MIVFIFFVFRFVSDGGRCFERYWMYEVSLFCSVRTRKVYRLRTLVAFINRRGANHPRPAIHRYGHDWYKGSFQPVFNLLFGSVWRSEWIMCRHSGDAWEAFGLKLNIHNIFFEKLRSANRMVLNTEGLLMDLGVGNEVHRFGVSDWTPPCVTIGGLAATLCWPEGPFWVTKPRGLDIKWTSPQGYAWKKT